MIPTPDHSSTETIPPTLPIREFARISSPITIARRIVNVKISALIAGCRPAVDSNSR